MARKVMVTRTIKSTLVNVLCMDEATFIANSVVLPPRTTNEQDAE